MYKSSPAGPFPSRAGPFPSSLANLCLCFHLGVPACRTRSWGMRARGYALSFPPEPEAALCQAERKLSPKIQPFWRGSCPDVPGAWPACPGLASLSHPSSTGQRDWRRHHRGLVEGRVQRKTTRGTNTSREVSSRHI